MGMLSVIRDAADAQLERTTHAQLLAKRFLSLDAIEAATVDELDAIEGIGPEVATAVHDWFRIADNAALIERLRAAGVRMKDDPTTMAPVGPQPLAGKTIV